MQASNYRYLATVLETTKITTDFNFRQFLKVIFEYKVIIGMGIYIYLMFGALKSPLSITLQGLDYINRKG